MRRSQRHHPQLPSVLDFSIASPQACCLHWSTSPSYLVLPSQKWLWRAVLTRPPPITRSGHWSSRWHTWSISAIAFSRAPGGERLRSSAPIRLSSIGPWLESWVSYGLAASLFMDVELRWEAPSDRSSVFPSCSSFPF